MKTDPLKTESGLGARRLWQKVDGVDADDAAAVEIPGNQKRQVCTKTGRSQQKPLPTYCLPVAYLAIVEGMACGFLTIVAGETWALMDRMTDGGSMPKKTLHMI